MSNPRYLKTASTVPSFSVEKRYGVPMCCSRPAGMSCHREWQTRLSQRRPTRRAMVSGVRCPSSQHATRSSCFHVRRPGIRLRAQLLQHRVVDRRLHEQVALSGAAGTEVVRLAHPRISRRFFHVGRFVDDHRRVPGADAVRGLAGSVGSLHHGRPAGGQRQVGRRHQSRLRAGCSTPTHCSRSSDALLAERGADNGPFVGRLPVPGMEKDHGIL